MINILYIHETSQISGAENSLFNLVVNRNKTRFKPYFILPEQGPFVDLLKQYSIDVELVKLPQIRRIFGIFNALKSINSYVKKNRINIIHTNSIRNHIYGAIISKFNRIPIIWHERNLVTYERIDLDNFFSFLPDKIICNSRAIADRFRKSKKVITIYNGVAIDKFNPDIKNERIKTELGINPDEILIGSTSRLGPDKGQEFLLKAAKIVLDKIPNKRQIKFLIVGSSVFEENKQQEYFLKRLTKELKLENNVVFTGYRTDMPDLYSIIDIFVLTSYAEPCGRVILEAMASGKPVIGTNTGGTPELVDDTCSILIPPKDIILLSDAIIELINNKCKRLEMGKNARKRIEDLFNIQKNVAQIQNIYSKLLQIN
jgi:glycosyltransferase involved in cell wall biosynthesis